MGGGWSISITDLADVSLFGSDGCGRSGTICAIMFCIERLKLEGVVDVFQTVRLMRTQRPHAIRDVVSFYASILLIMTMPYFYMLIQSATYVYCCYEKKPCIKLKKRVVLKEENTDDSFRNVRNCQYPLKCHI